MQRAPQQSFFYNNKLQCSDLTTNQTVGSLKLFRHSELIVHLESQTVLAYPRLSLLALIARNVLVLQQFPSFDRVCPHYVVDLPDLCLAALVTIVNAGDELVFFFGRIAPPKRHLHDRIISGRSCR